MAREYLKRTLGVVFIGAILPILFFAQIVAGMIRIVFTLVLMNKYQTNLTKKAM